MEIKGQQKLHLKIVYFSQTQFLVQLSIVVNQGSLCEIAQRSGATRMTC
jgi:hypothetical protein